MWELACEEGWALKNWCFWTRVLEKTLESPLDCKEIQPVHPKGDQSWVFIGRTDVEAETPILWPPDAKSWLIWEDPDAGRDWGQEEKGTTEDEMAGWHHQLDGHEFGWTPGVGNGQGGLACCGSWGRKESDTTERLNWTELNSLWVNWVIFLHILPELSPEAAFSWWPSWRLGLLHPWAFLPGFFLALWSQNQEGKDTGYKGIWDLGSETCTISLFVPASELASLESRDEESSAPLEELSYKEFVAMFFSLLQLIR